MPKPIIFEPSGNSSALDHAVNIFRDYLHFPDPAPLYATLGCIAGNMMRGSPIWLMLVGAPSNIKSTLVDACYHLPHCWDAGQMKNSSAFLTIDHGQYEGLLIDIGDFGILLYSDFSQVLSLDPNSMKEVVDVHRGVYGGRYSRRTGQHGGKRYIEWAGKLGALGAVTPSIDHDSQAGDLGERWVYFRIPPADSFQQGHTMLRLQGVNPAEKSQAIQGAMAHVMAESGVEYGAESRQLTNREVNGIALIAEVACGLRAVVRRDRFSRDVMDSPQIEGGGRISGALSGLYLGMEAVGVAEPERWRVLRKVGLDCAAGLRVQALKAIADLNSKQEPATLNALMPMLMVSYNTVKRTVWDLMAGGALAKTEDEDGGNKGYVVNKKFKKIVEVL